MINFQRATNIVETYNAVNPEQPLQPGDPRYVDLAPWRGSEHVVNMIAQRIILRALDEKGQRTTHSEIYLEHADHLKAPQCHIIYTVPISIYFNENLSKVYPDLPLMIPMIKVWEENGKICKGGLDTLRQVIAQRVDVAVMFENGKSVDKLCLASGGHIRDLLLLVRYACDYSAEKITSIAVDKAISALVRQYDRLVKDADLPRLIRVHREKYLPSDPEYALLPYHLVVLEYQNGRRWADLHPAVQATRKFKEAWEHEKRQAGKKKAPKGSRQAKR